MSIDAAIYCRGITKIYGEGDNAVHALRGIDLEIHHGELMMLVGPSGCGKTTLISVIAGILDRSDGQCLVLGTNLSEVSTNELTRWRAKNIGFVFQAFNLMPALTAKENVAIPLLIGGMQYAKALERADQMLDRVGLSSRCDSLPSQLSGGQQQRVAIARALVHEPSIVVCDEPTSALDHETGHQVMDLLRNVAASPGRALVVVTHDARIFSFADRIARMDDGHIVNIEDGAMRTLIS